jgi:hypothetical protein
VSELSEPVPDPFTQAVTAAACELVRVLVGEAFGPVEPDPIPDPTLGGR